MARTPLPANLTDSTRVLFRLASAPVRVVAASADLSVAPLEASLPVRDFCAWPGKRNYEGRWWSSTTREHIGFESLFERDALMAYDFDQSVVSIAAQPLAFLWPRDQIGLKSHVPDFFLRRASGEGCVVDVRPGGLIDEKASAQFALTGQMCAEIGWGYEIFSELSTARAHGLRWLSGYRQDRFTPTPDVTEIIAAVFEGSCPLQVGLVRVCKMTGVPKELALANVYHLLWFGRLLTDLSAPLALSSEVRS